MVVSCPGWVLGAELKFPARADTPLPFSTVLTLTLVVLVFYVTSDKCEVEDLF